MPEHVPIRDYLDALFAQHSAHVDREFQDLKVEIRANRAHVHRNHPTWGQLVTVSIATLAILVPVLVVLA